MYIHILYLFRHLYFVPSPAIYHRLSIISVLVSEVPTGDVAEAVSHNQEEEH